MNVQTQCGKLCQYTTNFSSIIMEFADNGDLYQKITKHQKERKLFKESEIWNIFLQVVNGMKALHDLNIYHRDLKVISHQYDN